MNWLRKRVFGIDPGEASIARRGFRADDSKVARRLERIGLVFLEGYHAALEDDRAEPLARRLERVGREDRGFAFEGAAMGLRLLDLLTPWRRDRFPTFLAGPGTAHAYMMYVGSGWATARLRRPVDRVPPGFDPLLRWLAVDGYGFHHGYFEPGRCIDGRWAPARLSQFERRVFDQGLGRSLWFVEGADADRIAASVSRFPRERRADLWSGVGLACAYAGGAPSESIEAIRRAAGADHPHAAQGAAFAAKSRERAGNPSADTERACRILCGMPAADAARLADAALADLPDDGSIPAYEVWRGRIRAQWSRGKEAVAS